MSGPRFYNYSKSPHYVYRCYDEDGRLIYVGCTVDPVGRLAHHRANAWWGHQISTVRNIVFPNKDYALTREREAIGEERPRWNVRGRWNHRGLWSAGDYEDYYTAVVMYAGGSAYNASHLERVKNEARQRYGLTLGEEVA